MLVLCLYSLQNGRLSWFALKDCIVQCIFKYTEAAIYIIERYGVPIPYSLFPIDNDFIIMSSGSTRPSHSIEGEINCRRDLF